MPITTTWLSRSSGRSSRCSSSICSTISPAVRLRATPSRPLAQNTQPMAQPTCVLMQIVRRGPSQQQHALDLLAVGQAQQQLLGAVGRALVGRDLRAPQGEFTRPIARAARLGRSVISSNERARPANSQWRICARRNGGWPWWASHSARPLSGSSKWRTEGLSSIVAADDGGRRAPRRVIIRGNDHPCARRLTARFCTVETGVCMPDRN